MVACIYIPDFSVCAVTRGEPAIGSRAVAVVDGTPPVANVVAMNEKAHHAGVKLSMPKLTVAEIASVEVRQRSPAAEASAHAALLDLGLAFSPRVEETALDTVVLDLAGLDRVIGPPEEMARRLAKRVSELGLAAHIAVAVNPDAAVHAARGFSGFTLIPAGEEGKRLGPLPVEVLAPPPATLETLRRWGVHTLRALAALPTPELSERLGQLGVHLQKLARGATSRPLVLAETMLHFEEAMELEYPIELLDPLAFIVRRLLDQLCARLAARSLATHEICLRLELENQSSVVSCQLSVAEDNGPSGGLSIGHGLSSVVEDNGQRTTDNGLSSDQSSIVNHQSTIHLPVPTRNSKLLLKLLLLNLQSAPPPAPVVKVMLSVEPVKPRVAQGGLFLPLSPDPEKLELTLARIAGVVGQENVGSPELVDTHRPGAFRMSRFGPSSAKSEIRNLKFENRRSKSEIRNSKLETGNSKLETGNSKLEIRNSKPDSCNSSFIVHHSSFSLTGPQPLVPSSSLEQSTIDYRRSSICLALRVFRPPLQATVEVRDGRPVRVFAFGMRGDARGDVVLAAGPWRASGGWWTDEPWEREEWDIALRKTFVVRGPSSVAGHRDSGLGVRGSQTTRDGQRTSCDGPRTALYRIYRDLKSGSWFVEGTYD
jgi:protein ImuB